MAEVRGQSGDWFTVFFFWDFFRPGEPRLFGEKKERESGIRPERKKAGYVREGPGKRSLLSPYNGLRCVEKKALAGTCLLT